MLATYVGPIDAVTLRLPDGSEVTVAHGEAIEVPADFGARLADQIGVWTVAPAGAAPAAEEGR